MKVDFKYNAAILLSICDVFTCEELLSFDVDIGLHYT